MTTAGPSDNLRVLDLFAGLGGWSAAFRDRGHEVVTVELDPKFNPTVVADIGKLRPEDLPGPWDIVLASPPCQCFSVASMGHYWLPGQVPTPKAAEAIELVKATLTLISGLKPRYWIMENPRAMMRNLPFMDAHSRRTVTYCQFGDVSQKPTDLWGRFPPNLKLPKTCSPGDPCHEAAPRGTKTGGTQGKTGSANRAVVPYGLSLRVCLAMENLVERPETVLTVENPHGLRAGVPRWAL